MPPAREVTMSTTTPDWEAWNRLSPDEQAARIQRHVAAHGRQISDPEAREAAKRYMADREAKRTRLTGPSDEERLMAVQGRHREELAAMDRQQRRAARGRSR